MSSIIKRLFVLLGVSICLLGVLVFVSMLPKIEVETKSLNVNIYTDYLGIKYKATKGTNDVSNDVIIDGTVDTNNLGTYPIKYKLYNKEIEVKVNVVDEVSPKIELKGDEVTKVCSRNKFVEPGYTVFDNYDSNLTDKVTTIDNESYITYMVQDSSGNIGRNIRYIMEVDETSPKISLNGDDTIRITLNDTYNELGATATDECEGNLTDKITIEGTVDTSKEATYELTYNVSDSKGNSSSIKRKVVVTNEQVIAKTEEKPKADKPVSDPGVPGVIYLTFDDGPGSYTDQILNTLAKYNIKATFFVTRSGSDATILREYNEGHTVGLHTYTHDWDIYKSMDTYLDDLSKISERVKNITGQESKYVRFPGGSTNQKVFYRSKNTLTMREIANKIESMGYKFYDWNVCVEDAGACASAKNKETCVINYFKNGLKKDRNNIVLLHDVKSYTATGLEKMIQYAIANGYTFEPITESTPAYHFI